MRLIERLLDVLTPEQCLVCQREGLALCQVCQQTELIQALPECYHCRRPSAGFATCSHCRAHSPLRAVYVAATYQGAIRHLIESYKFQSNRGAALALAQIMTDGLNFTDMTLTYCPTVPLHYRQRGFDHARLLAQKVGQLQSLPCYGLLRRVNAARQVGASRTQRLKQMQDAFEPRRPYLIKGQTILLIDDVMTTGATLESAARALKRAGAKQVIGLVVARAQ